MLLRPGLLEPSDGRRRQPAGVLAEQRDQRFLEVAGGDALEVEDRDKHLEAFRPARVGWQYRRREADALGAFANAIAHARAAHRHRADAGHDLTLGQMPMAHQSLTAIVGEFVGMRAEQGGNLSLDRLRHQRSCAVAQHLGQRIDKSSWLGELENISLGHGVSLLRWRVEASSTPTIRRLIPSCRHQLSPIARHGVARYTPILKAVRTSYSYSGVPPATAHWYHCPGRREDMFDILFGPSMPVATRLAIAVVIVIGLIGAMALVVRRFGVRRAIPNARGRQPPLDVIEVANVDGRRRLVLIRRYGTEHLMMIGGPTDVVLETNIMREATPREAQAPRPPAPGEVVARSLSLARDPPGRPRGCMAPSPLGRSLRRVPPIR